MPATTGAEIQAAADAQAAAAAEARAQAAEAQMTSYAASYSGPSVGDFLANPPYPNYDLASRLQRRRCSTRACPTSTAARPRPASTAPASSCTSTRSSASALPHSSTGQGAAGTRISESRTRQPGDLVIMDGHDGFYAGNGKILHAPYEGHPWSGAADLDQRLLHRAHRHLTVNIA